LTDPVDAFVGAKVRELRIASGITQQALAKKIGTTFQQVQKYEKGTNRISASRLQSIANALGTTPSTFFQGSALSSTDDRRLPEDIVTFLSMPECMDLTRAFIGIKDPDVRATALNLISAIGARK
jgi:transcriptional regulator with XRE-family HTH domain